MQENNSKNMYRVHKIKKVFCHFKLLFKVKSRYWLLVVKIGKKKFFCTLLLKVFSILEKTSELVLIIGLHRFTKLETNSKNY